MAEALMAASNDLIGTNFSALSVETVEQPVRLNANDRQSVLNAIEATELNQATTCTFPPMLPAVDPICSGASPAKAFFYAGVYHVKGNNLENTLDFNIVKE